MQYRLLADLVMAGHALFVLFVVGGGFLVWRWGQVYWLHLPAAAWGVAIEFAGWVCPLTPLENRLRLRAGLAGYPGGFLEHYMVPILYPAGLTRQAQMILGALALAANLIAYGTLLRRRHRNA
jgi:hypothetical protein